MRTAPLCPQPKLCCARKGHRRIYKQVVILISASGSCMRMDTCFRRLKFSTNSNLIRHLTTANVLLDAVRIAIPFVLGVRMCCVRMIFGSKLQPCSLRDKTHREITKWLDSLCGSPHLSGAQQQQFDRLVNVTSSFCSATFTCLCLRKSLS